MVCHACEAAIFATELGIRSCVDNALSAYGHCVLLGMDFPRGCAGEEAGDGNVRLPASVECHLDSDLLRATESRVGACLYYFALVRDSCDDFRVFQGFSRRRPASFAVSCVGKLRDVFELFHLGAELGEEEGVLFAILQVA